MRIFVPLTRDEWERLLELARAERRRPQEQAAVLIAASLTAKPQGFLPPDLVTIEAQRNEEEAKVPP